MLCLFLATEYGDIQFDDCLVEVEEPLRDIENLHGLAFELAADGDPPVYRFTGYRAQLVIGEGD